MTATDRAASIGGSDAATACGMNPWKSPAELWAEMTGLVERPDLSGVESVDWGQKLEGLVLAELNDRLEGFEVLPSGLAFDDPPMMHPEHEWMTCHPDGFAFTSARLWAAPEYDPRLPAIYTPDGLAEIKTAGLRQAGSWADGAMPAQYLIQCQHNLAVTGLPVCFVGALIGGQSFVLRTVEADAKLIDLIVNLEGEFYEHVQSGSPPSPDGSKTTDRALAALYRGAGGVATVPPDRAFLVDERRAQKEACEAADKELARLDQELKLILGDNETLLSNGERVATWKKVTRNDVKVGRLREEYPEIAELLTEQSTSRRFLFTA